MEAVQDLGWKTARGERLLPEERDLLFSLAQDVERRFQLATVVNIGVSWGASVHCLYAGAPSSRHIAIDLDYVTRPVQERECLMGVTFVEADSTIYNIIGVAHLVFVDGGHDYQTVKGDIDNWTPRIPLGGIIAFHDYAPIPRDAQRLKGVRRAIDEWRNEDWQEIDRAGSIVAFRRMT